MAGSTDVIVTYGEDWSVGREMLFRALVARYGGQMANPRKPVGVADEPERKRAAYGNYGSFAEDVGDSASRVREPGRPDREPWQGENRIERSPARPQVRQWATPSYSPQTGRAYRVADDSYTNTENNQGKTRHDRPTSWEQVPDAGDSTVRHTNNRKGRSRPGRW